MAWEFHVAQNLMEDKGEWTLGRWWQEGKGAATVSVRRLNCYSQEPYRWDECTSLFAKNSPHLDFCLCVIIIKPPFLHENVGLHNKLYGHPSQRHIKELGDFITCKIGNHWRVLNRGMIWVDLCFQIAPPLVWMGLHGVTIVTQDKVDGQQSLTFRKYLILSNIHSTIFFLFKPPVVLPAD